MTTILHIDASARLGRSHSRRLSARFVEGWLARRPHDTVIRRDVGLAPPPPVTEAWIAAAFTKPGRRTDGMRAALAVSDALVDELERADLIVAGVPMYNFGLPAGMKAWVDNIVRVGHTFGFDRSRPGEPYWPMLSGKRLVTLGARGDWGYEPGERLERLNHVEPHLHTVFRYIGITDTVSIAAEYDEFADERIEASMQVAEAEIDRLVARMTEDARAA